MILFPKNYNKFNQKKLNYMNYQKIIIKYIVLKMKIIKIYFYTYQILYIK